jgi:hypothetical protein
MELNVENLAPLGEEGFDGCRAGLCSAHAAHASGAGFTGEKAGSARGARHRDDGGKAEQKSPWRRRKQIRAQAASNSFKIVRRAAGFSVECRG